jgi:hypothetical protein
VLIAFIFLNFNHLNSQTFRVGNLNTLKATAFDPETHDIYAIWRDSIRIHLAPDYKESDLFSVSNSKLYPTFPRLFYPLYKNGRLQFVHRRDGLVLEFSGDSLRRIDKSSHEKMQNGSFVFAENDTLFRFGGNGFWTNWNFLTYFDENTQEWELIITDNLKVTIPGLTQSLATHDQENVYVFSGYRQNERNPLVDVKNNEVWKYNKVSNSWKFLGSSKLFFESAHLVANTSIGALISLNGELILVNPKSNLVTYHKRLPIIGHPIDNGLTQSFYRDGFFYVLHYKTLISGASPDGELVYEVISESEFLGKPYKVEPLYQEPALPNSWVISGLGIIAFALGIVIIRKRKGKTGKIRVTDNGISYANETIVLGKEEAELLDLLLRQNGNASSEEIVSLIAGRSLNESQKQKEKNRVVASLNLSMRSLLNEDRDLIQVSRSSADRRIKNYVLDISKLKL